MSLNSRFPSFCFCLTTQIFIRTIENLINSFLGKTIQTASRFFFFFYKSVCVCSCVLVTWILFLSYSFVLFFNSNQKTWVVDYFNKKQRTIRIIAYNYRENCFSLFDDS